MFLRVRHRKALCRDRFKACFRGFLRCSRCSSCGRDKLSEAGEFYLRYLARMQSSCLAVLCVGVCRIARRFEFCVAFGILRMCRSTFVLRALRVLLGVRCSHFAPPALGCCVLCPRRAVLRFGVLRVALYVVWHSHLEFYVRRLASDLASLLEISCEVVCASFDAFVRHPRLSCFACAIERSKTRVWRLALASPCVFCRACVTQRPMRAVKF